MEQNIKPKAQDRLDVLKKIEDFEKQGIFDQDVENDPEALELFPKDVDYLNKKLSSKIKTLIANVAGTKFFKKMMKVGMLQIKQVCGLENLKGVKHGAIITSNHFSPMENFAVLTALKPWLKKKRLWKVIKEGNYTNPPPAFSFLMKNGNTLPLSRNRETMRNFLKSIDVLLKRGENILVYPEQAMWWNYRKPRPFKSGAFKFAVTSNVPVIPVFITMEDSDVIGPDGFPIQSYTVNISKPIYPDNTLSAKENAEMLKDKNYKCWVDIYEKFYKTKLKYNIKEK